MCDTQPWNSSADWARTRNAIRPCWMPQNSAHCPGYSPAASALNQRRVSRFGKTSRLPAKRGGQKLWMTSAVRM